MTTTVPNPSRLLLHSQGLPDWLSEQNVSLALSTYQAGRLMMLGRKPDGTLRAHERLIEQCQGIWTDGQTLWTSGLHTLWRFEHSEEAARYVGNGVDRQFVPREGRVTGQIDIHDIGVGNIAQFGGEDRVSPIFVCTAFNCLATYSQTHSFRPLWKPDFISAIVGEDRCHLNGLAMEDGTARYVSAISRSDVADGWRERRRDGGVIIDVASQEIVADDFSMPHSPRLYQGVLWVLDSGRGALCKVDIETGERVEVAFCPGYARGLSFVGKYAVIGLSKPRNNQTFEDLDLEDLLKAKDTAPRCGLIIVDTETGQTIEWLRFEHTIQELYDVAILEGIAQPELTGFRDDTIKQRVSVEV
ncbi:MAG: TIGR03032 family protein [Pseudomonadota bacterium]